MRPLFQIAKDVFSRRRQAPKTTHPYYHSDPKSKIRTATFRVDDKAIAAKMFDWYQACDEAHQEVAQFVYQHMNASQSRGNFEYDLEGSLWRVAFVGTQPTGWGGDGSHSNNWMYAHGDEARATVKSLPQLPPRSALHDLINWPTLPEEFAPKNQRDLIRGANRQAAPHGDTSAGETFINIPLPDNYAHCPQIEKAYRRWFERDIPHFLTPVDSTGPKPDFSPE